MLTINPTETPTKDLHQYLLGAVAPRPIAFVSTMSSDGVPNLAPYSFFNCFSSNPPILVFSSNRRVEGNTTKDTLANIYDTMECVINVVSHDIARQMTITSVDFPKEVSEFEKAGLTPVASELVKPFRVAESPAQMECKVERIIPLGEEGGAGHLIICHVVRMYVNENVLDEGGRIDPVKIDLMGRMGKMYYSRSSKGVETIVQNFNPLVIGYDQLPRSVQQSEVFTGYNLGQLSSLIAQPKEEDVLALKNEDKEVQKILMGDHIATNLHRYAQELLKEESKNLQKAACVAWLGELFIKL